MRVVIGYESMYGTTHRIADAIAAGFDADDDVVVRQVHRLAPDAVDADVLIIGAPTHAHGLPRPSTRQAAVGDADTKREHHVVDADAMSAGVREWLETLPASVSAQVAAYDTRFPPPGWLVGHPARRICRELKHRGGRLLDRPESFFVDKHEQLHAGEIDRARRWGAQLREKALRNSAAVSP